MTTDHLHPLRLTRTQLQVIAHMQAGWELGQSLTARSDAIWLQRDGLGKGGPSQEVRKATFYALLKYKLIAQGTAGFPTQPYALTPAGQAVKTTP